MKYVTRTITTTTVYPAIIDAHDGIIDTRPVDPMTFVGKFSDKAVMNALKKEYGKENQYVILNKVASADTYAMPIDEFTAAAKKLIDSDQTTIEE